MFKKIILLLLMYFSLHGVGYAALLAEWKFEEGSGVTVSDTSGNGNTGILENSPNWVNGKVGKALEFDGTNRYFVILDTSALSPTNAITLEAWINSDEITLDVNNRKIIEKDKYALGASSEAYFRVDIGGQLKILACPWSINNIGVWHHLVGTYDSVTGAQILYQNGVVIASTTISGLIDKSSSYFHIGWQGETTGRFDGIIDEVRVYDNALTASEVLARYLNGNPNQDTTAPASVINLTAGNVTTTSVTLNWTSVGDDNSTGTASIYDIRYQTYVVTSSNWANAIPCSGEPMPKATGNSETFIVNNLNSGTTYFFAMKIADEVLNWSDLSNVVSKKTSPDTTTPSSINNLTTNSPNINSITLTWTSVGDDGTVGTATSYDIRYQTYTITNNNFINAIQVTGEPTPKASGNTETFTINGLTADTTYFFAMKVADEALNWADLSNVVSCATTAEPVIDNPPTIIITNPTNGATVSGTIIFSAIASDDKGIAKVDFYVDGSVKYSITTAGTYSWSLDTTIYANGSHILKAVAVDTNNQTAASEVTVTVSNVRPITVDVGISADINPRETVINPVKGGKSSIKYTIGNKAASEGEMVHVTVEIYNTRGELVKTLVDEDMPAGNYQSVWDGRNFENDVIASGVYIARLKAGKYTASKKLVVIK